MTDRGDGTIARTIEECARILPLFAEMNSEASTQLLQSARICHYVKGTLLFERGAQPRALHVVLDGQVGLFGIDARGREAPLEVVRPGGMFIAAAVLTGKPYVMRATVIADARLVEIPIDAVRTHLHNENSLAAALLTSLAESYRQHVKEVEALCNALESRLSLDSGKA
jgi:CRP/FNR family transcriptional regulator, transcriptional activator FtrB